MKAGQGFGGSRINTLIRVKDHEGTERTKDVLVEHFKLRLSPKLLEDGRGTQAGDFLLRILAATDYAGKQGRPIMLTGRKLSMGGFALSVSVPVDLAKRPGPPPAFGSNGNGVERTA